MVLTKDLKQTTLLVSLLSLISLLVITYSYFNSLRLNSKNAKITEQLNKISVSLDQINVSEKDFLDFETINPSFHKSGNSKVLKGTFQGFTEVKHSLHSVSSKMEESSAVDSILTKLNAKINSHRILFDSISISIRTRGYKDFGLEGRMRQEIHFVENNSPFDNLSSILMLRRHEKDYFIRKEEFYITEVRKKVKELREELKHTHISEKEKHLYDNSLKNYLSLFNEIVFYEKAIGINRNSGLSGKINEQFHEITKDINEIKRQIHKETKSKIHKTKALYFAALAILISVILLSLFTSFQLGKPIEKLSQSIELAIHNDFDPSYKIFESKNQNEIAHIGYNVQKMLAKIILQKEFLMGKNLEVNEQNNLLNTQKIELKNAFQTIEQKNKNLTASISYAKYIQNAFLPTELKKNLIFPSNFIVYEPKSIVSGDFYLIEETETTKIIIVCDCTGHGVPGAFMTVLGNMLLDNSLKKEKMSSPSIILEYLDCKITQLLGSQKELNSEGMDISICIIDKNTRELTYSGARSPLFIYNENKWTLVKGIKRSIGEQEFAKKTGHQFTNHTFKLQNNDKIFLWTDGYKDQFGGASNKKIGSKRLRNIIKFNEHESLKNLGKILKEELNSWRNVNQKAYDQTDDILVVGVEVDFNSLATSKIINETKACC